MASRARATCSYPSEPRKAPRGRAGGLPGPGHVAGEGARARARVAERAGGRARAAADGVERGARCRGGCLYGREGAAAGQADSTPCAHAPAPAGYKAAAPAPPDKVASSDVTGPPCGCRSQRTRRQRRRRRRQGTRAGPGAPRSCGPRRRVTSTLRAPRGT